MPRKIAYIGFGALGKQLAIMLRQTNKDEIKEICFDDAAVSSGVPNAYPFQSWSEERFSDYDFFICLGYKQLRIKGEIVARLQELGRHIPAYIHPTCIINPDASIGDGCILYPGCNIDHQVKLNAGVFLNNGVVVCHDSEVGAHSFLAPGAIICGNVSIGEKTFIGAGTVVSNGVSIGTEVIVGVGTVVTTNIAPGASVIGNPMRVLTHQIVLQ